MDLLWIFYMRLTLNLSGLLEDVKDVRTIPYILKMYLKDIEGLPMIIDPKVPFSELATESGELQYQYNVTDKDFSITIDYTPKD